MANENNNINELVADDNDPTAELEVLHFGKPVSDAEADAKTYNSEEDDKRHRSARLSVSELESDLQSREKLIGRLQFDLEQLHAKKLGLEAEVSARESQTAQLNSELVSSHEAIERKEKSIEKRDQIIEGLESEIRLRDESYRELEDRLEDLIATASESAESAADPAADDLASQLRRTEEYADSIRRQSLDLSEKNARAEREIDALSNRLAEATRQNADTSRKVSSATSEIEELQSALNSTQIQHDEESLILQDQLSIAQVELIQAEEMKNQVATDLVEAQNLNDELERQLGGVKKQSTERISQLEQEVSGLTIKANGLRQELTAKSEAISILLADVAEKAERIDKVEDIEEVIQDIDEQLSEYGSMEVQVEQKSRAEKVSRVLVGTVDDRTLRFPLFKKRLTIGRTRDNDIQIKAVYVSRRHAVIQTDGNVTRIIDWGSKNGVRVNSSNVSEHFLSHGDTIIIGNARFRYEEHKKRDSA